MNDDDDASDGDDRDSTLTNMILWSVFLIDLAIWSEIE